MRTKRLAIAAAGGIAYLGYGLALMALFGPKITHTTWGIPSEEIAKSVRALHWVFAAPVALVAAATLYEED